MRQRSAMVIGTTALGLLLSFALLPVPTLRAGSDAAARGKELFATKGCAHCHGDAGVGGNIGPDLQLVRKRMDAPAIHQQIHDGSKSMPAFGDELADEEINDLVAYLRAKRKLVAVPARPVVTVPDRPVAKDPE